MIDGNVESTIEKVIRQRNKDIIRETKSFYILLAFLLNAIILLIPDKI